MEKSKNKLAGKKIGHKKISIGVIVIIGTIILYFSAKSIVHSASYESTDNAQIDGSIIPIRTKTGGYVMKIYFKENQLVKKGDTLAIMDTTDLKAQVVQAEARLESSLIAIQTNNAGKQSATFSTEAADNNISSAKAKLWQTEKDYKRIESMYKKEAATSQVYDAAKSGLDMAKAQYKAITAQKRTVNTQITVQDFQIKSAEARVKEARAQLISAKYLLQ